MEQELLPLLPSFIESRWKDMENLELYMIQGDYTAIKKLGHNLRGISGAFGFTKLVQIATNLEAAANKADHRSLENLIEEYRSYLTEHYSMPVHSPEGSLPPNEVVE
ncbi:MAG: hypothetical protein BroJett040_14600 [Oligoflexia bacterium]|nr:MAG: hypothetical protein BroJett040_14600 [Oligoflexia bacterium]